MQRLLGILFSLFLTIGFCRAEFSATGGINGTPFVVKPPSSTNLDKVFVFNDMQNASLAFSVSDPENWSWYRFKRDVSAAELVSAQDIQISASATTLTNLQADYGYFVASGEGLRHYVYVVGYKPVEYSEIRFVSEGSVCTDVTLKVTATMEDLDYYSVSGLKRTLEREHTLSWNTLEWDATAGNYAVKEMTATNSALDYNWSVAAPLTDTYFTLTGDQYAKAFGIAKTFQSAMYSAVAVETHADAVIQERDSQNEIDRISESSDLSGSAPLVVQFHSYPSEAVKLVEWYVYKPNDATGAYTRFTDVDLLYTFKESGQYTVKTVVSNSSCQDSAIFNPLISESKLECPNFFTPRSSPGENDEFKVAYRSIVSFKGVIVNRWGNVMFEWTDPSLGWDGKYKGKAVSPGVYFYVIEAKGSDGINYKKRGDINLLE